VNGDAHQDITLFENGIKNNDPTTAKLDQQLTDLQINRSRLGMKKSIRSNKALNWWGLKFDHDRSLASSSGDECAELLS